MIKKIENLLQSHDLDHFGFCQLTTPLSLNFYKAWLEKGYHGDMAYLKNHLPKKENPQALLPQAQSAIVFTIPYYPKTSSQFPLKSLKVARYANQEDYHFWLQKKINTLCSELKQIFPDQDFLGFTDSSPVLERDLAHKAGLGWFGKNTCLIDRKKGSLFFIAEIYTSLNLQSDIKPTPDHCGTCTKCIDACPTDALLDDKTLDATKCISYWTIESKQVPPEKLRENFKDWFFGCDICQEVCPWNTKIHDLKQSQPKPEDIAQELKWILTSSNKKLMKTFHGTPLSRAGGRGLKRNALIVAANLNLVSLKDTVEGYAQHEQLGSLALWALEKLH